MAEHIIEIDSVEMYKSDMAKYSVIVNRRRAVPAIQDGLKPVQRRLVFAAYKDHLTSPSKKDKSASLVGLVMRNYHPHGETYGSIVTLVAWYKTKYPLFYGQGNWGNVSGDGAASSRYTECALSNFGYDTLIDELSQSNNIVDWLDTYKRNGDKEPEYLPAKIPLLLINGTFGIGVGMQCAIPSHNLGEVIDATLALIKNPESKICLIPDLPQGCDLICNDWQTINDYGEGSFKVRGRIVTEVDNKGNYTLHIVSLPDQVNSTDIYNKINDMIAKKQLPMIKDIFDSLKDEKPDIIIQLKQGSDPEYLKQILYAKTQVQTSVRVNFEVVAPNGIDIKRYSYKEYLLNFIDFRMNIKFRLYCNKLQQVMTRHYKVDAFIKVIESGQINNIIDMIRKYKGTDDEPIIEYMIKKCNITDIQAKFILGVNLSRLSAGHLKNYKEERKELQEKIDLYTMAVTDDGSYIKNELIEELKELKKKYNTPRLCKVISVADGDNIPAGVFKVVITERNYIRKIPDVDKVGIIKKDNPKYIIRIDNRDNLLLFDNKGKVFNLPVHKIPITDKAGVGVDIRMLIRNCTSDIVDIINESMLKQISEAKVKNYMVVLTKSNIIKKLDIEDFLNVGPSGLIYSKIKPEDEVVGINIAPDGLDIVINSGKKALRCSVADIPLLKRNALGSKAMNTNNPITGMSVFYPDVTDVIIVTANGKFNRFPIALLDRKNRAKGGNSVIKLDKGDNIISICGANSKDSIRVTTSDGVEVVPVESIKVKSSIAPGEKILKSKGIIVKAYIVH